MHTLTKQPVKCKAGNVEHKKLHRKKVQFPRSYFMRHFKEFVWIKRWMALNKNLVLKVWKNMRSSGEIPRKGFNEYVLGKEKNKVQLLYLLFSRLDRVDLLVWKAKFIEIECFRKKVSWGYWDEDGQNDLAEDVAAVIATEDVTWENDPKLKSLLQQGKKRA